MPPEHKFIRTLVEKVYGVDIADNLTILYGGSVKPDNAKEIFSKEDVDELLKNKKNDIKKNGCIQNQRLLKMVNPILAQPRVEAKTLQVRVRSMPSAVERPRWL